MMPLYESPEAQVLLLQPEQVIATSNELEDFDNNPIYKEKF